FGLFVMGRLLPRSPSRYASKGAQGCAAGRAPGWLYIRHSILEIGVTEGHTGRPPDVGAESDRSTAEPPAGPTAHALHSRGAAPGYQRVLYEDERVRVLDAHCPPGETVPVHTHCWAGVLYILGSSDFIRRDPDGNVLVDTRSTHTTPTLGSAVWGAALTPH